VTDQSGSHRSNCAEASLFAKEAVGVKSGAGPLSRASSDGDVWQCQVAISVLQNSYRRWPQIAGEVGGIPTAEISAIRVTNRQLIY